MEFAENGDLLQKIMQRKNSNRHFKEQEIWNVVIQISSGLY